MKTEWTEEELRARLKSMGKTTVVAMEAGVAQSYLSEAANGKVPLGPKLLDYLGVERVVIYREKQK
jgi:transcriptional regulator with XRE-family HTH domain